MTPGATFSAHDVAELVGPVMMERGVAYAREGRVVSVARGRGGRTVVGHVRGTGGRQYVAVVELTAAGEPTGGSCSCPVGTECKHVAATLLVLLASEATEVRGAPGGGAAPGAEGLTPAGPVRAASRVSASTASSALPSGRAPADGVGWEAELAPILAPAEPAREHGPRPPRRHGHGGVRPEPLALQVELAPPEVPRRLGAPDQHTGGAGRLLMRPVVRGASGRWIRTGISWSELRFVRSGFDEAHVEVLRSLYGLAGSAAASSFYFDAPVWVDAATIPGTPLWALLADARRSGLPVVESDRAQTPVEISGAPIVTEVVVEHAPDGGVAVSGAMHVDGRPLVADELLLLGAPAAGAVRRRGTALNGSGPLQLLPLDRPLDPTAEGLLTRPAPLHVPAVDAARFLTDAFPALRERFGAASVDARVTVPARPTPRLVLQVLRLPDHVTHLDWQWRYASWDVTGTGAVEPVLVAALDDPFAGARWRDLDAEERILGDVAPRVPRLQGAGVGGASTVEAHEELTGMRTARFFTEELGDLLALAEQEPDLAVDVQGAEGAPEYRDAETVDVAVEVTPVEGDRDWFDLGVVVHAENRQIPLSLVFTALAKGQDRLLLDDGLVLDLDDERFDRLRELIAEARVLGDTMGGTVRVSRFHAGLFEELEAMGVLGGQTAAWREALGGLVGGARPETLEVPAGLDATLRPYQHEGFEWLDFLRRNRLGGILADDMGLGKTLQTLALVQRARETAGPGGAVPGGAGSGVAGPQSAAPFLVVAPTSVVDGWVAEARRFTPGLRVVALRETRARRGTPLAQAVADADVVVTSYAIFRLDAEEIAALPWQGLVLDEAQTVKNHQSVGYQCARRVDAPFKIALTGTPLENNLLELWSLLSIVCPGLFPLPSRFTDYYARPIERNRDQDRLDQLRRRIAPFMLRRTKDRVASDLPSKQEQVAEITLNPRHRRVYDQYLQRERANVLGLVDRLDEHRFEVFRSLTVLRQAALDASLVDEAHAGIPSSKLTALFEMLDDVLAEGHSVLVFSQFTRYLGRVREELVRRGIAHSYLDGRTRRRGEAIEDFTSGRVPVFLVSLKAGGVGLNLTAADYCILLDPWWNPAAEAQAVDRAHRIGQTRRVMVYRLVATGTIEEKVMALKASKAALFSSVVDGGAAGGRGLTADDVRELLA